MCVVCDLEVQHFRRCCQVQFSSLLPCCLSQEIEVLEQADAVFKRLGLKSPLKAAADDALMAAEAAAATEAATATAAEEEDTTGSS